jgi:hypothetical protein
MHNLMSRNQLAFDNHFIEYTDESETDNVETMNDYFECLIECELESTKSGISCKRVCKEILM